MANISPTKMAAGAGISIPYASQIINGKRAPARSLAIRIFRQTGWKHPSIADLTEDQIKTLEAIDPWVPRQDVPAEKLRA